MGRQARLARQYQGLLRFFRAANHKIVLVGLTVGHRTRLYLSERLMRLVPEIGLSWQMLPSREGSLLVSLDELDNLTVRNRRLQIGRPVTRVAERVGRLVAGVVQGEAHRLDLGFLRRRSRHGHALLDLLFELLQLVQALARFTRLPLLLAGGRADR